MGNNSRILATKNSVMIFVACKMIRAGLTDSHALISMGMTADNLAKRYASSM